MTAVEWRDEITWLWRTLKKAGFQQEDLAIALGKEPSTVGRWNPDEGRGPPKHPNQDTRNAIARLLDPDDLDGWEAALRQVKATVEQMERVAELRRVLIAERGRALSLRGDDRDPLEDLRRLRDLADDAKTPEGT